jgi:phosphoribosyl 1,2-cyclic phosphate phosphodiesterase
MRITFLGTGNARGMPVWGSDSPVSKRARADATYRRYPSAILVEYQGECLLVDAGRPDLSWILDPFTLSTVCISHYHSDHVIGLLTMKWGKGKCLKTFVPKGAEAYADIALDPGILDLEEVELFQSYQRGPFTIIPIPLKHSIQTQGFWIACNGKKLAYLSDTCGLPEETTSFLKKENADLVVLDCNQPFRKSGNMSHNGLEDIINIQESCQMKRIYLTHIGETMDQYLMDHEDSLPVGVQVARDGACVDI